MHIVVGVAMSQCTGQPQADDTYTRKTAVNIVVKPQKC